MARGLQGHDILVVDGCAVAIDGEPAVVLAEEVEDVLQSDRPAEFLEALRRAKLRALGLTDGSPE